MRMTSLYISPHLDDVAFSCAGGLLARVDSGARVVVCTVFSKGAPARAYAQRRREDQKALIAAGAECVHLDFEDAPARENLEASFRALVLDPKVRPALVRRIERAISEQIRQIKPDEVWLPIGIGGHIDHRTVFAARAAAGGLTRFYEDRPYAFVPALRALRFLELGGVPAPRRSAATILRQFERGACDAMLEADEANACVAEIARRLKRRGAGETFSLRSRRVIQSGGKTLDRVCELVRSYRTQTMRLRGNRSVDEIWRTLGISEREVVIPATLSARLTSIHKAKSRASSDS
jgi:LmbE family N-acetylglucosaminyl deacetylase